MTFTTRFDKNAFLRTAFFMKNQRPAIFGFQKGTQKSSKSTEATYPTSRGSHLVAILGGLQIFP